MNSGSDRVGRGCFSSKNRWGMPEVLPQGFGPAVLKSPLEPFRSKKRKSIAHFFLMDRKFECVWNRPVDYVKPLKRYAAVCTPDFSLYRDRPMVEQMWNVYRNRWCGRYWQAQGIKVIPTVRWSTPASFRFCFSGISPRQILATGTPDLRDSVTRGLFTRGLEKMFEILEPRGLILYGIPPKDFPIRSLVPHSCRLVVHPHRWQRLRLELMKREHGQSRSRRRSQ